MSAEGVTLTEVEREALRTSGSWPNVGTDLFAAVERILAARFRRVCELADGWEQAAAAGGPRNYAAGLFATAADDLRAALGGKPTGPIIHSPGCDWETGPDCSCGADPQRCS